MPTTYDQHRRTTELPILCLWFRASLIYINNSPTRCNTKQSIYYSANSLYIIRLSDTANTRSTQNCNYSLRYWSYFLCKNMTSSGGCSYSFVYSWWWVWLTPETRRVIFFTFCWPCTSVYLSQYLTNLMHKICFTVSFISFLYMFRAHVLIIRRSHLQVWWYQRLCNAIVTSWWWAHVLETCRGMK